MSMCLRNYFLPPFRDFRHCVLPRNSTETTFPLPTIATKRIQDTFGMVNAFQIVIDLRTQRTARKRMGRISVKPTSPALADLHQPRTSVRTVMATGPTNDTQPFRHRAHSQSLSDTPGFDLSHTQRQPLHRKWPTTPRRSSSSTRKLRSGRPGDYPGLYHCQTTVKSPTVRQ